jgi:hypothetical protein
MTAFDDDPEYEAQLKDVLGEQLSSWQNNGEDEEMGDFVAETDDRSEDGVLDDAPTFRMKLPPEIKDEAQRIPKDEDDVSDIGLGDTKLSEDARSISTGDDSPSIQVTSHLFCADSRDLKLLCLRLPRQVN